MQAYKGRQFVSDHSIIALSVAGLMVVAAIAVVALALSGDLPGFRESADEAVAAAPAAANIPEDRMEVGAGSARQWSTGDFYESGLGEGWVGGGALAQEQLETMRGTDRADEMTRIQVRGQVPTVLTQDSTFEKMEQAPGEGLHNYRFIEENVQLPSAETRRIGPGEGLNEY